MGLFRRRGAPQGTALLDEDTGDLVAPLTPEGEADRDGEPGPLPEKMGLGDEEVAEDATTPGKHARKVSIIAEEVRALPS